MTVTKVIVLLLGAAAVLQACGSSHAPSANTTPEPRGTAASTATLAPSLDSSFLTAVATVTHRQYTIYWLGPQFSADGVTFTGPEVPGIGGIVHDENMKMQYSGRIGRGGVGLEISLYSPEAWSDVRNSVRFPAGATSVTRTTVTVFGHEAELISQEVAGRPVNALVMIIELPDATIVAVAPAGGVAGPNGGDINPLVDETTLVTVMNSLRPYPQ